MKITDDTWRKRIQSARARREPFEPVWREYARLHSESEAAVMVNRGDIPIELPSGDTVKLGLVFRNIEQTMGYLEMDDIGITARATSYTRPLDNIDTNNEAVVEQAIYDSMTHSGLTGGPEKVDRMKLDALLTGHSINFSWWKVVEEDVEIDFIPELKETDAGTLEPILDKHGKPKGKTVYEALPIWEGVADERISPLDFLVSSTASSMDESHWLGFERIIRVSELKQDPRYADRLPKNLKGGTFTVKSLAGERGPGGTDFYMEKSVRVITVWDKDNRELLTFIETDDHPGKGNTADGAAFTRISQAPFPVRFDNPGDSPFAFFIPIPAADHPFGVSQVEHIRNPALESDILRTRFANQTAKQKRFLAYDKNKVDPGSVEEALTSNKTLEAIGLDVQDGMDMSRLFKDMQTGNLPDTILNAASQAEETVRKNSGVAETPFGGTETATESENQMMIGQARVNRKRNKLFSFLQTIAQNHLAFLRTFAPSGSQIRITLADGADAILNYGREAFQGTFNLKVQPGGGPSAISPVRQKMLIEAISIVGQNMGPKASLMLYREVLTQLDIRNVNGILQAAREHLLGGPQPGPGGPGQLPGMPEPGAITDMQQLSNATNVMQ